MILHVTVLPVAKQTLRRAPRPRFQFFRTGPTALLCFRDDDHDDDDDGDGDGDDNGGDDDDGG